MWILILTLIAVDGGVGQTVVSVPGFTSMSTCDVAGRAWARQIGTTTRGHAARYVCAKT